MMKRVCIPQIDHRRGLVVLGKKKLKLGMGYGQGEHHILEEGKNASFRGDGGEELVMVAHK